MAQWKWEHLKGGNLRVEPRFPIQIVAFHHFQAANPAKAVCEKSTFQDFLIERQHPRWNRFAPNRIVVECSFVRFCDKFQERYTLWVCRQRIWKVWGWFGFISSRCLWIHWLRIWTLVCYLFCFFLTRTWTPICFHRPSDISTREKFCVKFQNLMIMYRICCIVFCCSFTRSAGCWHNSVAETYFRPRGWKRIDLHESPCQVVIFVTLLIILVAPENLLRPNSHRTRDTTHKQIGMFFL